MMHRLRPDPQLLKQLGQEVQEAKLRIKRVVEHGGEPKTPVSVKPSSKKRGKAPHYSNPKYTTLKQVERAMETPEEKGNEARNVTRPEGVAEKG